MDQTFPYRVRTGQRLAHDGVVLEEGAPVSLTRAVAAEIPHLVDPVDSDGRVIDPPTALQVELEARPEHEHEGILRRRRAELSQYLADLTEVATRTAATASAAAADVDRVTRAIADIDAQLEPSTPAPAAEPVAAPPKSKTPKTPQSDSSTPPAPPAEKE